MFTLVDILKSNEDYGLLVDGVTLIFTKDLYIQDFGSNSAGFINLKNKPIYVRESGDFMTIDELLETKFSRANIYIMQESYKPPSDHKEFIKSLNNSKICMLRVGDKKIIKSFRPLLIECAKGDNSDLISEYNNYFAKLGKIEEVQDEVFNILMDLPQYGVIDNKLFVVNEDDTYISRLIIYQKEKVKGELLPSITMVYFSQNYQEMQSHIVSRIFKVLNMEVVVDVNLNKDGGIEPDTSIVIACNLNKILRSIDIKSVVKLFNRENPFDDDE